MYTININKRMSEKLTNAMNGPHGANLAEIYEALEIIESHFSVGQVAYPGEEEAGAALWAAEVHPDMKAARERLTAILSRYMHRVSSSRFPKPMDEETAAIKIMLQASRTGELWKRLHRCTCGKWFWAARTGRKVCSAGCRVKRYAGTANGSERHREAAKRQHERHRGPKVQAVEKAAREWELKSEAYRAKHQRKEWIRDRANQQLKDSPPVTLTFITRMGL